MRIVCSCLTANLFQELLYKGRNVFFDSSKFSFNPFYFYLFFFLYFSSFRNLWAKGIRNLQLCVVEMLYLQYNARTESLYVRSFCAKATITFRSRVGSADPESIWFVLRQLSGRKSRCLMLYFVRCYVICFLYGWDDIDVYPTPDHSSPRWALAPIYHQTSGNNPRGCG